MRLAYIGIDLGGSNLRGAMVDPEGSILVERSEPVGQLREPEAVLERVGDLVDQFILDGDRSGLRVGAVGIGLAGWYNNRNGVVVNAPNLGWRNVPFREMLRQKLSIPFLLCNDLSAVAYGEYLLGSGRGSSCLLCVFVGTGVGSSVLMDGKIFEGATGYAGELGHIPLYPSGEPCSCGGNGHLEAYTGGAGIERRARAMAGEEAHASRYAALASRAGGEGLISAAHVESLALEGDAAALSLWEETSTNLAMGITAALCMFNPDVLVLGGGVMEGATTYRQMTLQRIHRLALPEVLQGVRITSPQLGRSAGVVGAALLGRDSFRAI